jgi:hypothetical protein
MHLEVPVKRSATVYRFADPRHICPNCCRRFYDLTSQEHTESGCFLGMLVALILDRGITSVNSADVAAFEDVDGLWDRWGAPAADEVEEALGDGGGCPTAGAGEGDLRPGEKR